MTPQIFQYAEYRAVMAYFVDKHKSIRGYRTKMASAINCSSAYLSQVMNSHVQLSQDQGLLLANFWSLAKLETDFFLALIGQERAGTPELKAYIGEKIERLREKHTNVGHYVAQQNTLSLELAAEYYSSWLYQAIHVAISVPQIDSLAKLVARFGCDRDRVSAVLHRLMTMGLIEEDPSGGWRATQLHTHVDRDSPNFANQHKNWRLKSCEDSVINSSDSVLYTGVYSLSQKTAEIMRNLLLDTISKAHDEVVGSAEEEVFTLQIDWYKT